MLRKYLFKQRTFMTTLVLSLVFYVLLMPFSAVLAANDSYVNVNRDGWTFYLDGDRIIATNGTQYAFFNDAPENEKDVDKRFNQKKDFFKQQGEAFSCGSHIDRIKTETVNRGKTETKISYKLYEEGNGGPGCGQNTGYTIGDIKVEDSVPANVKKTAAAFNYGNEPRGCPGSADIPNNANKKELNYNCPDGGAIIKGKFEKNQQLDTPKPNEDNGNDCNDVGGAFGWIICAVGSLGSEVIEILDNAIYGLLYIPMNTWQDSGVQSIWSTMRTIASVLIVLVALVGIASQVFNFDFISAYTVRKILPKLFIAVILIQLSWFLGTMAINISNTVGFSVQALITAPFEQIANSTTGAGVGAGDGWIGFADVLTIYGDSANHPEIAGGGVAALLVGGVVVAGAAAYAAGPATVLTIVLALTTAAIGLLMAFVVIALRYVLILSLLIVAPLALVAWILPNTKKWFDQWWSMFFTLLVMFPVVIAVLSFGKIAAIIIALSTGG
ncbi:hypothetical protein KC960_05325 [Candidatus Saccharibacteria bacterium]|nr:hypothetical protein [Candidatus Saccharibacteria bacterium]